MLTKLIVDSLILISILNPIEAAIVLLSLKDDFTSFKKIAFKTSLYVFVISVVTAFSSSFIFSHLNILSNIGKNSGEAYIAAVKVIGGIILFFVGWIMVNGKRASSFVLSKKEHKAAKYKEDISFIPMAVPVIVGPGVFTTLIVMGERARNVQDLIGLFFVILISTLCIYFALRYSKIIIEFLGIHGVSILCRLTGVFIMIISVLFFIEGVKELWEFVQ